MLFKLKSVFVSTRRDSDKPEKINISVLSGCCLWTLRYHKTLSLRWYIETSSNLFFSLFMSRGLSFRSASFGCHENSDPRKQLKKKRFNLVSILSPKMFLWSRNAHRRQQPERIEIFIVSGLSLSRPTDTKADLNLNNIIAIPQCPQTWTQLRSMNAKAGEHRRSELCGLDFTISARCKPTSFPLRHWNLRNLTLHQECYLTNIPLDHSRFLLPTQYFRTAL